MTTELSGSVTPATDDNEASGRMPFVERSGCGPATLGCDAALGSAAPSSRHRRPWRRSRVRQRCTIDTDAPRARGAHRLPPAGNVAAAELFATRWICPWHMLGASADPISRIGAAGPATPQPTGTIMPARFWFDNKGLKKKYAARGVPDEVIRGLNGDIDRQQNETLARFFIDASKPIPEDIVIPPKYALYIGGTTDELSDALKAAIKSGINSVCVTNGQLAVWYLRRNIENSEEFDTLHCRARYQDRRVLGDDRR